VQAAQLYDSEESKERREKAGIKETLQVLP
jgi:hypothetical protein